MTLTRSKYLEMADEFAAEHGPDTSVIIHTTDTGWTIRYCDRYADLCREGMLMSNCWGREFWLNVCRRTNVGDEAWRVTAYTGTFSTYMKAHQEYPGSEERDRALILCKDPDYNRRIDPYFYFSLRDPDNLPRCSFFAPDGRPQNYGGRHNDGVSSDYTEMIQACSPFHIPTLVAA